MKLHIRWLAVLGALICLPLIVQADAAAGSEKAAGTAAGAPNIPKTWSSEALRALDVPLTKPEFSAKYFMDEGLYYRIPVRPMWKSYPIYHPSKEPAGYLDDLAKREPEEIVVDPAKLKTEEDWIRAGEQVFDAPLFYETQEGVDRLHDLKRYESAGVPVTKDGIMPFNRYFIYKKGKVRVGQYSCSMCHTRVMPDGSVIKGAQGNFPKERLDAYDRQVTAAKRTDAPKFLDELHDFARNAFGAPWLAQDPWARYTKLSFDEIQTLWRAIPPGVQARVGTSVWNPVQVPDLIGLKDRTYLDHTGLTRNRSVGDLMRYAVNNQGGVLFANHGDFKFNESLPPPEEMLRYSDEQVYALALYLYSLKAPQNPHRLDAQAERGKAVFEREGCGHCHTPPLYTNNKLTPVHGFDVPPNHPDRENIFDFSVGTDPGLALATRRGTGFYKVPSLLGLWYRGPL